MDVTDTLTQDAIAESLIAPQESEQQISHQTGTGEEQFQTDEQQEAVEQEQVDTEQEVADDWLPTEQEKVFPDATIAKYAQRYGYTLEEIQADPRLHRTLTERLNNDIYINQLRTQQAQQETQKETEQRTEPTRQPVQQNQALTHEQYFSQIRQMVQSATAPEVAQDFFKGFNRIFGVTDEQMTEMLKANPNAPMELTAHMGTYALNLIHTLAPQLIWSNLQSHIESIFPQFPQMYERASYAYTWDTIRNSNAQYAELPAFGTKEFSQMARTAAEKHFGSAEDFESAVFTKVVNGQRVPLSQAENTQKKYTILANVMMGQKVDPALVQQAVQTGQRQARRAQIRREAGSLGSGQSKQQIAQPQDDFWKEGLALYRQEHGRV